MWPGNAGGVRQWLGQLQEACQVVLEMEDVLYVAETEPGEIIWDW
jgi:hypothetical protein